MPKSPDPSKPVSSSGEFSIHKHLILAILIIAVMVAGIGGWAASAKISGAVIALGTFVVERNVKKVQHSQGGIVAEIAVKNGDQVEAGAILLKLDATQIRAELGIVHSQIVELTARSARLRAERDGAGMVVWPEGFVGTSPEADTAASGEERLFSESRKVKISQKDQLRSKLLQIDQEVTGLTSQRGAKAEELKIVGKEVRDLRPLLADKLTTTTRVNGLEREMSRLEGDRGSLVAQIARAQAQINEVELQILAIDETTTATSQRELVLTEAKLAELAEREIAARDKLSRIDIRAPLAGQVHELAVHTVGGVITAAEQIMLIIPDEDRLTIQARLQPNDIDQVKVGRPARLRLTAFSQQQTPEIDGTVVHIAGDITTDPKTGAGYYAIRVEMDPGQAKEKAAGLRFVPGMPVEVFFSTGDRTVLSYLAKPFTDQMYRAFREGGRTEDTGPQAGPGE
jgi:HlyD family secretion protein